VTETYRLPKADDGASAERSVAIEAATLGAPAVSVVGLSDQLASQRRIIRRHPLRTFNAINVRVLGADLLTVHVQLILDGPNQPRQGSQEQASRAAANHVRPLATEHTPGDAERVAARKGRVGGVVAVVVDQLRFPRWARIADATPTY
jgi:hypothetical protein